ncbi:MAG: glycosyltransferase [Chromatiales bacterium]|nr:glycosyltransferase [Chromatiales bacterium]
MDQLAELIVPARNAQAHLPRLAESLNALVVPDGWQLRVTVVDDASTDSTAEAALRAFPKSMQLVCTPQNLGRGGALNLGVSESSGAIIAFLDSDCAPKDHAWLQAHLGTLASADVSLGELVGDTGDEFAYRYFDRVTTMRRMHARRGQPLALTTANVVLRREWFERIGGFDEGYSRYGFEDRDLLLRLKEAGARIRYTPGADVVTAVDTDPSRPLDKLAEGARHSAPRFRARHPAFYRQSRYGLFDASVGPALVRWSAPLLATLARPARALALALAPRAAIPFALRRIVYQLAGALAHTRGTWLARNDPPPSGLMPALLVLTSTYPRWANDHEPAFVHELARRLTDRFRVTVLAPHAPGSARSERLDGVDVRRFRYAPTALESLAYESGVPARLRANPFRWLLVPGFVIAQFWSTQRLIRELLPAAIHAHWLIPQGLLALLARTVTGSRARVLVTAHGADVHVARGAFARRLLRHTANRADEVTAVSRALAQRLVEISGRREVVVRSMGAELGTPPEPAVDAGHRLLFTGRLVAKKGVDTLLAALPTILERVPDVHLVIAGDGPERAALEQQTQSLGIAANVEFAGPYRPDQRAALYAAAGIAVFPFRVAPDGDQEGLGLVVLEAVAQGRPVIAGDVPAVRDLIEPGRTGLLFPPGDTDALARAVIELLESPERGQALASAAYAALAPRYDWSAIADAYARLLAPEAASGGTSR